MRVGTIAAGRAGDKGDALDLTLVARDRASYARLEEALTVERVRDAFQGLAGGDVLRYPLPRLDALKFVLPHALPGGVYLSTHPGMHWQKAAIYVLLDLELP